MSDEYNTQPAVWNSDGAQLLILFNLKEEFLVNLRQWDLEGAYFVVRNFRMELDSKLKMTAKKKEEDNPSNKLSEKQECDKLLAQLSDERILFLHRGETDEARSRFYSVLENFYLYVCRLMKKHGLYFRESDDPMKAILRR